MTSIAALLILGVVGTVTAAEVGAWRVSRRAPSPRRDLSCAVIVLGYPSARRGAVHAIQRWRTRIALRTLCEVRDGYLIFSGGTTRGAAHSEAAAMARYAVSVLGAPSERVMLEEAARSTWENVLLSLPLVESIGAEQIAIASDPFHAEKARRYVAVQRPAMASQVVRAADYRILEQWWLKVATGAYYALLRSRGTFGSPPSSGA